MKKMKELKFRFIPHGFLKANVLAVLKEGEAHGYEIRKKIYEKSCFWKPSFGTLYPLLRKMVKEGLIKVKNENGKKVYSLTKKGKKIAKNIETLNKEIKSKVKELLRMITPLSEKEIEMIFKLERKKKTPLIREIGEIWVKSMKIVKKGRKDELKQLEKILKDAKKKIEEIEKS